MPKRSAPKLRMPKPKHVGDFALPAPFNIGDVVQYSVRERVSDSDTPSEPKRMLYCCIVKRVMWMANGHHWQYDCTLIGAWWHHNKFKLLQKADKASLRLAIDEEEEDFRLNG